jgi:hypothetical protein
MTCNAISITRSTVRCVWWVIRGVFRSIKQAFHGSKDFGGKQQTVSYQKNVPEADKPVNETAKPGTALQEADAESDGSSNSRQSESISPDLRNAITSGIDPPVAESASTQLETSMNTTDESSAAADDESAL